MKLEDINFTLTTSVAGHKEHVLTYRDDKAGVQMEICTPRGGKPKRVFSIDKIEGKFNHEAFIKVLESITIPPAGEREE